MKRLSLALLVIVVAAAVAYVFRLYPATVPDVVGLPEAQAWKLLSDHGLTSVDNAYLIDQGTPTGHVISQSPRPGRIVLRRTFVSLVISGEVPGAN